MKTSRFFSSFLTAIFKLCALKSTSLLSLLCYPKHYNHIPPQQNLGDLARVLRFTLNAYRELNYTLLYEKKFMSFCTTKYIFFLGKNRFIVFGFRCR